VEENLFRTVKIDSLKPSKQQQIFSLACRIPKRTTTGNDLSFPTHPELEFLLTETPELWKESDPNCVNFA